MKLSKTQRRINVFKDAISQIRLGQYKIKALVYVDIIGAFFDDDAKKVLTQNTRNKCRVCADGALVCSLARLENNRTIGDLDNTKSELAELFGRKQVDLIESFFERQWKSIHCFDEEPIRYLELFKIERKRWFKKYPDKTKRVLAIFRNAIRNKGVFKP